MIINSCRERCGFVVCGLGEGGGKAKTGRHHLLLQSDNLMEFHLYLWHASRWILWCSLWQLLFSMDSIMYDTTDFLSRGWTEITRLFVILVTKATGVHSCLYLSSACHSVLDLYTRLGSFQQVPREKLPKQAPPKTTFKHRHILVCAQFIEAAPIYTQYKFEAAHIHGTSAVELYTV